MNKYFSIIERFYDLSIITFLVPSIIAIFRWRFFNFPLKIVAIHTIRGFVISSTALAFYYINYSNRLFYYLSPCLDIILISLITSYILKNKKINLGLITTCLIFILLMIYDFFNSKTMISTYLTSAETFIVIMLLLLLLRKITMTFKIGFYRKSFVWILSSLLIGNLFSILVTSLNQIILNYSSELLHFSWYLSSPIVIIITNIMTFYGFYVVKNQVKFS